MVRRSSLEQWPGLDRRGRAAGDHLHAVDCCAGLPRLPARRRVYRRSRRRSAAGGRAALEFRSMTTASSPIAALTAQAVRIVGTMKLAERRLPTGGTFPDKVAAARGKPTFKVTIAMDDG